MTKDGAAQAQGQGLAQLARDKLTRVLGAERAQSVFAQTLAAARLTDIRTPDDLYLFGEQLSTQGGFEAAVGRLLTVAAILRGSTRSGQQQ
jgi:hypothetical protein